LFGHVSVGPTIFTAPLLLLTQAEMTPAVVAAANPIVVVPTSATTSVRTTPGLLLRSPRANEDRDPMNHQPSKAG